MAGEQPQHDPEQVLIDLTEKLATRRRHVVLLLGAGTGCAAGLPDLAGMAHDVGERLEGAEKDRYQQLSVSRNVEQVLTHLRLVAAVTAGTDQSIDGLDADGAKGLDHRICSAIAEVILETPTTLEHHRRFGTWVARSQYDSPVEIFTTNYDLLLEHGLEQAGAPYFDGFIGVFNGRFRTDLVDPSIEHGGPSVTLPPAWVRLWKLHGSVSWVEGDAEGSIVRVGGGSHPEPGRVLVIYPSLEKYVESRRLPFVVLADRFRRALATPETLVVTCGYSFGDEHINELLFEAARLHARSETIALFHGTLPDVVTHQAVELPNLTALGRLEGIIGTTQASWREPSVGVAWKDGFALGDFAVLSEVLARRVGPTGREGGENGPS